MTLASKRALIAALLTQLSLYDLLDHMSQQISSISNLAGTLLRLHSKLLRSEPFF
jgi:hypothetical protein